MTTIPRFRAGDSRAECHRRACHVSRFGQERGIGGSRGSSVSSDSSINDIPDVTETPANSIRKGSFAWRRQGELAYLIELVTAWTSDPSRRRAIGVPALNRMLCPPKRLPVPDAPPAPRIRCPSPPHPPPPPLRSPLPPPHASRAHPRPSPGASRLLRAPPHRSCSLRSQGTRMGSEMPLCAPPLWSV